MDMPTFEEHLSSMGDGWGSEDQYNSFCLEDQLLELYEAFYPNTFTFTPPPPPTFQHLISSSSFPFLPPLVGSTDMTNHEQVAQQQFQLQHPQPNQRPKSIAIRKKRKTEQRKTVYRVPAENILTLDKWAWRKYGQKPIKGSPFPRNYYRCSSTKGCAARKQVERSLTEPEVYVVTYSGDHFHPWPVHRNALAGVSRADHRTCSFQYSNYSSQPISNPPQEAEEEEEGEALLIPNRMYVDEYMLRGIQELNTSSTSSL